ncbi:protein translocase subunit SecF [Colwellia sp. 6_MG-2023]|uniref:protein translocase subunit SecF n=1 Tax=Colwellia sp. 6_MG-2023 TaxID=3062676 RepID=UPI0026E40F56|nr:protein translocase subunit SecF [Colwellia sp. 6_MG-2023]MDO6486298.1 protein translocase subunit SecF [Colwellia sp. 6_MG-2023]
MNNVYINRKDNLSKFRLASLYFASAFVLLALLGLFTKGLNLGLDFTGGYLTEFSTEQSITQSEMTGLLSSYLPDGFKLSSTENGTYWSVQQADNLINIQEKPWLTEFSQQSGLNITPQDAIYIGSQVGDELIDQGGLALLASVLVILLYLSVRFEWRLASGSVIALFHDVIVVLGIFAWFDIPFDLTIVASLLAIIGYSLNDSIIIGDKVREIMKRNVDIPSNIDAKSDINEKSDKNIDSIINIAIKATIVRTLITSGTTLATILAIWIFAGESLVGFSIALFSGVLVGTFSSITISATVPQLLGLSVDYYQDRVGEVCQLP